VQSKHIGGFVSALSSRGATELVLYVYKSLWVLESTHAETVMTMCINNKNALLLSA